MATPVSNVPSTRIKGAMNTFDSFYTKFAENPAYKAVSSLIQEVPSLNNARDETFRMLGDPPGFERWDEGSPRVYGTIQDQSWSVEILKWQAAVAWKRIDEEDDISKRLRPQLERTAKKAVLKKINVLFQILQSTSDSRYLKSIPTCADGLALFSSSRALMGTTGNIVAGNGIASVHQILADYNRSLEIFHGVRDTHNDFLHDAMEVEGAKVIFANPANRQRFQEAFEAKTIVSQGAAVDNVLAMSNGNVTLVFTPRVVGNSWYIALQETQHKPIFMLTRSDLGGVEKIYKDESNSDRSEDEDSRRIVFRLRAGYGCTLPMGLIQVSN